MAQSSFSADTGTLWDLMDNRFPVIFNQMVDVLGPTVDPIFRDLASSQNVVTDGYGRDMVVKKSFVTGMTGNVEMAGNSNMNLQSALYGDAAAWGAGTDPFYTHEGVTPSSYPDALPGAGQKPFTMNLGLNVQLMNMSLSLDEVRLDDIPATIGEVVMPKVRGWIEHVLWTHANQFYTTDSAAYAISGIAEIVAGGGDADTYLEFVPDAPIQRYRRGLLVDIAYEGGNDNTFYFNSTDFTVAGSTAAAGPVAANANARVTCMVTRVDPWDEDNGKVRLELYGSATTWGTTLRPNNTGTYPVANQKVYLRRSRGASFAGLESWLKNSGYLLGSSGNGIDVDLYPEFKSPTYAHNDILTEQFLRQLVTRFNVGMNAIHNVTQKTKPNVFLTTPGVVLGYISSKLGKEYIQRGSPLSMTGEGGGDDVVFDYMGTRLRFMISMWSAYGKGYMLEWDNNWKRYEPPARSATSSGPGVGGQNMPSTAPIEFIAPFLTGTSSVRLPYQTSPSGGGAVKVHKVVQFPADCRMQWCPNRIPGMIVSGITEERLDLG